MPDSEHVGRRYEVWSGMKGTPLSDATEIHNWLASELHLDQIPTMELAGTLRQHQQRRPIPAWRHEPELECPTTVR